MKLVKFGQLTEDMASFQTGHVLACFALLMAFTFAAVWWIKAHRQRPTLGCRIMLGVHLATVVLYGSDILWLDKEMLEGRWLSQPGVKLFFLYWALFLIYTYAGCSGFTDCVTLLRRKRGSLAVWSVFMLLSSTTVTVGLFVVWSAIFCLYITWGNLLKFSVICGLTATLLTVSLRSIRWLMIKEREHGPMVEDAFTPAGLHKLLGRWLGFADKYPDRCYMDPYCEIHLSELKEKKKPLWVRGQGSEEEQITAAIKLLEDHHKVHIGSECLETVRRAHARCTTDCSFREAVFRTLDQACEELNCTNETLVKYRRADLAYFWLAEELDELGKAWPSLYGQRKRAVTCALHIVEEQLDLLEDALPIDLPVALVDKKLAEEGSVLRYGHA